MPDPELYDITSAANVDIWHHMYEVHAKSEAGFQVFLHNHISRMTLEVLSLQYFTFKMSFPGRLAIQPIDFITYL